MYIILMLLIFLSILVISGSFFILNCIKLNNHFDVMRIKNFERYITTLHYFMERAYQIIYKEDIMIYSMEGMKISDEQFRDASKKFVTLVMTMIGPNLKESYMTFYGNDRTLYFNIMEYFNNKYENDEIQKAASNKIMNFDNDGIEKSNLTSTTDLLSRTYNTSYNNF